MAHTQAQTQTHGKSTLARVIPAIIAISVLGLVILIVGDIAGVEGANEGEEGRSIFDVAWLCFSLGAIIALITGVIALLTGRSRRRRDDERAGKLGIGYFLIAAVVTAITASLT